MIIDCISDPHGFYPKLKGGDLLLIAGDLTANDTQKEFDKFFQWHDQSLSRTNGPGEKMDPGYGRVRHIPINSNE